jgi:hypothetical protein
MKKAFTLMLSLVPEYHGEFILSDETTAQIDISSPAHDTVVRISPPNVVADIPIKIDLRIDGDTVC